MLLFFCVSDTEKFYTEVQEIILARYNKTFDWSLKAKMMGKKAIEAARVFVEETGISDSLTAEDFLVEREEMLQKMFPTSDLMPGTSLSTSSTVADYFSLFISQVSAFSPFLSVLHKSSRHLWNWIFVLKWHGVATFLFDQVPFDGPFCKFSL